MADLRWLPLRTGTDAFRESESRNEVREPFVRASNTRPPARAEPRSQAPQPMKGRSDSPIQESLVKRALPRDSATNGSDLRRRPRSDAPGTKRGRACAADRKSAIDNRKSRNPSKPPKRGDGRGRCPGRSGRECRPYRLRSRGWTRRMLLRALPRSGCR